MIELKNVHKKFGHLEVLKGIDLTVAKGEKLVIIGPSGSGKSTLIRCMNGLEEVTAGEVYIDGQLMTHKTRAMLNRQYSSMVFQQFNLYPHLTVMENLTLAPIKLKKIPKDEAQDLAMANLKRVGLAQKANAYPATLSGGQQQRIAIARSLTMKNPVIYFDEPTSWSTSCSSVPPLMRMAYRPIVPPPALKSPTRLTVMNSPAGVSL